VAWKTYSALLLAYEITNDYKIALIDIETNPKYVFHLGILTPFTRRTI
jgi:hypothetical protein